MGFFHSMTTQVEGIERTAPVVWQSYEGFIAVHWRAQAQSNARGYYLAPDPRIMIFFEDISSHVLIADTPDVNQSAARPLLRATYVPARMPIWTRFTSEHRFSHLDLHFAESWLLDKFVPALGRQQTWAALRQPVEHAASEPLLALGQLLATELDHQNHHPLYAESLAISILTGLLDLKCDTSYGAQGGLTPAQMQRLTARFDSAPDARLSVADMSQIVGLSESWFAHAFKTTTGMPPVQWQRHKRIELACQLLLETGLSISDIAARLGFSDQAHLTRVFRQISGETPAAWRRRHITALP